MLRVRFRDYLAWLDALQDRGDYFTPAYQAMQKDGFVRLVQTAMAANS